MKIKYLLNYFIIFILTIILPDFFEYYGYLIVGLIIIAGSIEENNFFLILKSKNLNCRILRKIRSKYKIILHPHATETYADYKYALLNTQDKLAHFGADSFENIKWRILYDILNTKEFTIWKQKNELIKKRESERLQRHFYKKLSSGERLY